MRPRVVMGNIFLTLYFWVTMCALLVTLFRIMVLIPRRAVLYSYGMIAPYQNPGITHQELLAEGLREDGSWERINLAPYYPVLFGERNAREYFTMFTYSTNPTERGSARATYAATLLRLEKERHGNKYQDIRLSWLTWPSAPGEFNALQHSELTQKDLLYGKKYE